MIKEKLRFVKCKVCGFPYELHWEECEGERNVFAIKTNSFVKSGNEKKYSLDSRCPICGAKFSKNLEECSDMDYLTYYSIWNSGEKWIKIINDVRNFNTVFAKHDKNIFVKFHKGKSNVDLSNEDLVINMAKVDFVEMKIKEVCFHFSNGSLLTLILKLPQKEENDEQGTKETM